MLIFSKRVYFLSVLCCRSISTFQTLCCLYHHAMLQDFETCIILPSPLKKLQHKTVKMVRVRFYINKLFKTMCDASLTQAAFYLK